VLDELVAGIGVRKDMIKVAIRSPGETPRSRGTEVSGFRARVFSSKWLGALARAGTS
jgi:hypothetical protein